MNNIGLFVPNKPSPDRFAFSMISLTSFTPEFIALNAKNGRLEAIAIILASVVFPIPGVPQKIKEGIVPCSMCLVKEQF